jgi:cyclopropane fatty-acyl-phospholipid synthase-like methyltransferase
MINYDKKNLKLFFKNVILPTFEKDAHFGLLNTFEKNLFEVKAIVDTLNRMHLDRQPVIIDFGCGLGINLMILSKYYGFKCIGIDRYEEFQDSHKREVGSTIQVIDRLEKFDVEIIPKNPVTFRFDFPIGDVSTSFDVIEHFNFPPIEYLNNMVSSLNDGGYVLVGTPNQAHIFNRIKLLFGFNVWEDFQYWLKHNPFYGHVRELTTNELKFVIQSINLKVVKVLNTSYPFNNRIKNKFPFVVATILNLLVNLLFFLNPKLNYYNLVISKKNND